MIFANTDLCDLCNTPKAQHYLSIATGLVDVPTLAIRLCPACQKVFSERANTLVPLFDTVLRALALLRSYYQLNPLPSSDAIQADSTGAIVSSGPLE